MNIVKLNLASEMPEHVYDAFAEMLREEFTWFCMDVENNISELYCLNNELWFAINTLHGTINIIAIYGKNLNGFGEYIISTAKALNINSIKACTRRCGMEKYMQSVGAIKVYDYSVYELGLN